MLTQDITKRLKELERSIKRIVLNKCDSLPTVNLINGRSQEVTFVATSAKNKKGNSYDSILTINWKLEYTDDGTNYN